MKHPVTWVSLEMSSPAILYQYLNALMYISTPPIKGDYTHKPPSVVGLPRNLSLA